MELPEQEDTPRRWRKHDLGRFVQAQAPSYATALSEIRRGAKRTHWMWFVFPQIAGLGSSDMTRRYAIEGLSEARAYYADSVLGGRYRECLAALQDLTGTTAEAVFGGVDAMKLRSSLTLFWRASDAPMLKAAIDRAIASQGERRYNDAARRGARRGRPPGGPQTGHS